MQNTLNPWVVNLLKVINLVAIAGVCNMMAKITLDIEWISAFVWWVTGLAFVYATIISFLNLEYPYRWPGILASGVMSFIFLLMFFGAESSGAERSPTEEAVATIFWLIVIACVLYNLVMIQIRLHQVRAPRH